MVSITNAQRDDLRPGLPAIHGGGNACGQSVGSSHQGGIDVMDIAPGKVHVIPAQRRDFIAPAAGQGQQSNSGRCLPGFAFGFGGGQGLAQRAVLVGRQADGAPFVGRALDATDGIARDNAL